MSSGTLIDTLSHHQFERATLDDLLAILTLTQRSQGWTRPTDAREVAGSKQLHALSVARQLRTFTLAELIRASGCPKGSVDPWLRTWRRTGLVTVTGTRQAGNVVAYVYSVVE